jgi:hypothetical protein
MNSTERIFLLDAVIAIFRDGTGSSAPQNASTLKIKVFVA